MKYLESQSDNPRWLDSRVFAPSPKCYAFYSVIFWDPNANDVFKGRAAFIPQNDYTEGRWDEIMMPGGTTGVDDAKVLYWLQYDSRWPEGTVRSNCGSPMR